MNAAWPQEIEVRELMPNGARYVLPGRPVGWLRYIGLFPLIFGACLGGFAISWMLMAVRGASGIGGILFMLFGGPLACAGLAMMVIGVLVIAGHTEIELRDTKLHVVERFGLFHWSRRRAMNAIKRIVLKAPPPNQAQVPSWIANLGVIAVECAGAKPLMVGFGYPPDWLEALAADLARRCNVATPERLLAPQKLAVAVERQPLGQLAEPTVAERAEQPAGSRVVVEQTDDALTLTIPSEGLRRGSRGLLLGGIAWLVICIGMMAVPVVAEGRMPLPVFFSLGFFVLVGVAMLLGAVNMGRRRAVIAVAAGHLIITQSSLFGIKTREWPREQLAAVRAGPSGMAINDVPVIELQVLPRDGRKFGLLSGRDTAELEWLATVLRRALNLPART